MKFLVLIFIRGLFLPITIVFAMLPVVTRRKIIAKVNRLDSKARMAHSLLSSLFRYEKDSREELSTRLLTTITFFTLIFIVWGYFSEIEQVIQADAKVFPFSRLQSIEHFEGGRVKEINVKQGDIVTKGDILLTLSPIAPDSEYQIRKDSVGALGIKLARLNAELGNKDSFSIDPELKNDFKELIETEQKHFRERKKQRLAAVYQKQSEINSSRSKVNSARASRRGAEEEAAVVVQLVKRGLEPRLSLIRSEKALEESFANESIAEHELQKSIQSLEYLLKEQRTAILSEISDVRAKYSAATEDIKVAADKAERTRIRSPINGVVNRVLVSTKGGTVKPGETIVEIVPEGSTIVVEANVLPSDIGFVEKGQRAIVKLTAYDFSLFGSLEGIVELVAADSITNDKGEQFYIVKIDLKKSFLKTKNRTLKVIPGMTAQVDIITGSRTVWNYVFSPISRVLQESLREK
ncbi:MAG: HlyD family type I secretion periplasmic adaptor subunit [Flavobacteriaceae bacterium]